MFLLNNKGGAAMQEFLAATLKDQSLLDRQEQFEKDIDADGHFELPGRYTVSGAPARMQFTAAERVS